MHSYRIRKVKRGTTCERKRPGVYKTYISKSKQDYEGYDMFWLSQQYE